MRKTDIRAYAALPDRTMPEVGVRSVAPAGSFVHLLPDWTSPAVNDVGLGVVAIMNAALYHVCGFRRQVDETFKEWKVVHEFAESAILAERVSLDWEYFVRNPMGGNATKRSSKAEEEMLCRAAVTLKAKLSQHFVPLTEAKSDVDDLSLIHI